MAVSRLHARYHGNQTMRVPVILDPEKDKKMIEFEDPDYDEAKAEICRRFEIDSDIKLIAVVEEEGQLEEYSISSSRDLQDLWNEFKELHVSTGWHSGEKTVVFNQHDRKRVRFPSQDYDHVRSLICEVFKIDDTFTLHAITKEYDEEYSVKHPDDLKLLWNRITELRVTGKIKRLVSTNTQVMVNGEMLRIDEVPSPKSKIVQNMIHTHGITDTMTGVKNCLRGMGDVTATAYNLAVAIGDVDLQQKTKDIGFKNINICRLANNTIQTFISSCSTISEVFTIAVVYLVRDNDFERALKLLSSLGGEAGKCKSVVVELITEVGAVAEERILSTSEIGKISNQANDFGKQAERSEKDVDAKQLELQQVTLRINSAGTNSGTNIGKIAAIAGATKLGVTGITACAASGMTATTGVLTVGAETSTLMIQTLATPAAPAFLLGAAALGLACYMIKRSGDEEAERARMREENERQQLQLQQDLQRLKKDITDCRNNKKCVHHLHTQLLILKSRLEEVREFFDGLLIFCEDIIDAEKLLRDQLSKNADFLQLDGFKAEIVRYQSM